MKKGKVYLVGAGPSDPGLLTLRGAELISRAEVIIYDNLAARALLEGARPEALLIYAGKKGGEHFLSQEEINRLLIEKAREGREVVRLKGGDPFLFGRGGEEAEELAREGIPFEVIPGVSSAMAVPAYAGIPVTHRAHTSTVAFVTGHEDPTKGESSIDWEKLSTGAGTLVFLMGVARLPQITRELIKHGRSPETPTAVIEQGTTPAQRTVVAPLGEIAERAKEAGIRPPAITVVGGVVSLREALNWFERKPLFGRRIVVTRSREQASEFGRRLREEGAEVIEFPTIELLPPESFAPLDEAIGRLKEFGWIIFTSANGVNFFSQRLEVAGLDSRALSGAKICAIGPGTAEALRALGLRADLVPGDYRAEGVVEGLEGEDLRGVKVLIPRAERARELLPEELKRRGALVEVIPAYRTLPSKGKPEEHARLIEDLKQGRIDMVTFTSSSTVENFLSAFPPCEAKELTKGVAVAAIGPITAKRAEELGLRVSLTPERYTIGALSEAIIDFFSIKK